MGAVWRANVFKIDPSCCLLERGQDFWVEVFYVLIFLEVFGFLFNLSNYFSFYI
jgi:hypothetical protein